MDEKTVLIMTTRFPPPFGGAATRAWYLSKMLSDLDYRVFVLELIGSGYSRVVNRIRVLSLRKNVTRYVRSVFPSLLHWLKKIEPQVVIATNPPREAIIIATRLFSGKATIIADVQDITDEYKALYGEIFKAIYRAYYSPMYKSLAKSDYVFSTTEAMAKYIEDRIAKKVYVAYNGSDPELYREAYEKNLYREPCKPICTLVFVGSLDWKYQRLEKLIQAIAILDKKYKYKIRLRVIGSGKYLQYYMHVAEKYGVKNLVRFYGYVPREKLPDLVASSDIGIAGRPAVRNAWIMVSIRMTIYDYLAAGIPVIAFGPKISYTRLFIEKHRIGYYIGTDDPNILAKTIYDNIDYVLSINRKHCRKISLVYEWNKTLEPIIKKL